MMHLAKMQYDRKKAGGQTVYMRESKREIQYCCLQKVIFSPEVFELLDKY